MHKMIAEIKEMDTSILKIMKTGLRYAFGLMLISCMVLLTYNLIYPNPTMYEIGISLFKSSAFFVVDFIVFGVSFNKIKQDLKI